MVILVNACNCPRLVLCAFLSAPYNVENNEKAQGLGGIGGTPPRTHGGWGTVHWWGQEPSVSLLTPPLPPPPPPTHRGGVALSLGGGGPEREAPIQPMRSTTATGIPGRGPRMCPWGPQRGGAAAGVGGGKGEDQV